jgi:signal transduction histidine kinase
VRVGFALATALALPAARPPWAAAAASSIPPRPGEPAPLTTSPAPAADSLGPGLHFRLWTNEDGLPNGSVRSVAQTPDGYLWIATLDGLVRVDGVRMQVFSRSEIPEMASNRCLSLVVDPRGVLWVGTEDSGILRVQGDRVRSFGPGDGLPAGSIFLRKDPKERIWAGDLLLQDDRWAAPPADVIAPGKWPPLVSVHEGRLEVWAQGRITSYPTPPASTWEGATPVLQENGGVTWVMLRDGSVVHLQDGHVAAGMGPPSMSGSSPRTMQWYQGPGGRIWAFDTGYLHVRENGIWRTHPSPLPDVVLPLPEHLFEDLEGTLWIGGNRGLVQASATAVRTLLPPGDTEDRNVYTIALDPTGRIWGCTAERPFLWERGSFVPLDGRPWWPADWLRVIVPDADGSLWGGGPSGVFHIWPGVKSEWIGDLGAIQAMLRDREGTVWAATEGRGVSRRVGGTWHGFRMDQGLASNDASALLESRDGAMWVGTYGGLSRIENGEVRTWKSADGLSSEKIRSLYEDESGVLWVGTYDGGLNRVAPHGAGGIVPIRKRDGLFDDGAFVILDDLQGHLWMSSNRGVYSVAKSELEAFAAGSLRHVSSRAWRAADGMPSSECNGGRQPAGFRAPDGSLWFPTQRGVAIIDPRAVRENTRPPQVILEEVTTDRRTIPLDGPFELAPGERRLEVRFTAATFVRPEGARFRHQLVGFDPAWVEDGSRRFAQYALLSPGSYTLRILAANSDGVWSPAGVSVPIMVRPYLWQTTWFRWGIGFLGIVLAGLAYSARISRLKRRRAEQDAFARRLIESQESERKRIAGELHDGIGQTLMVIRNRALLGLRDGGELDASAGDAREPGDAPGVTTGGAHGAARLLRQLHEISGAAGDGIEEVRKIAYGLRPYQLDRLGLSRAVEAVAEQAAASSGIPIAVAIDDVDGVFAKDDEINVYRIVQEGVSNVIHHARAARGRVAVAVRGSEVEITIEDDGAGFDPAALAAAGKGGLGLSGIAERARILGGRSMIRSSPGQGTVVTVILPLAHAPRAEH